MSWAADIVFVLLPVSLIFMTLVLRGKRIGNHPYCRRCQFDLFGKPDTPRCPECGADLKAPFAVIIGERKRNARLITAGIGGLVTSLILGTLAIVQANYTVNWPAYKPVWWLLHDAGDTDALTRANALSELRSRYDAGRLSSAQLDEVIIWILDFQGNPQQPWTTDYGDFLERARTAHQVSQEQWIRYARQALPAGIKMTLRSRVRRGDPLPCSREIIAVRAARETQLGLRIDATTFKLNGDPLQVSQSINGGAANISTGSRIGSYIPLSPATLAGLRDGTQTMQIHLEGTFLDGPVYDIHTGNPLHPAVLCPKTFDSETSFELLPFNEPSVTPINNPGLEPAIRAGLSAHDLTYSRTTHQLSGMIDAVSPPADLAFDALIQPVTNAATTAPAQPYKAGHITFAGTTAPNSRASYGFSTQVPSFDADHADIHLHASPAAALSSVNFTQYWNGSITLSNVPVAKP